MKIDFVVSFQMSRLFVASILDPPGELEQRLETAHRSFLAMYLEPVAGDDDDPLTMNNNMFNCTYNLPSSRLVQNCFGDVDKNVKDKVV